MTKWDEKKQIDAAMERLRALLLRGLRMGLARGIPFCGTVLAAVNSDRYRLNDESLLGSLREDMVRVEAFGHDVACVAVALDAMLDTPGAHCARLDVQDIMADDVRGVASALSEAATRVAAALDAMPAAVRSAGRPVVSVYDMRRNRWCTAEVRGVSPTQLKLTLKAEPHGAPGDGTVTVKRLPDYPIARDLALDLQYDELDAALRMLGHEPPARRLHGRSTRVAAAPPKLGEIAACAARGPEVLAGAVALAEAVQGGTSR